MSGIFLYFLDPSFCVKRDKIVKDTIKIRILFLMYGMAAFKFRDNIEPVIRIGVFLLLDRLPFFKIGDHFKPAVQGLILFFLDDLIVLIKPECFLFL